MVNYDRLKAAVLDAGHEWRDDELMIVGVRGHEDEREVENETDRWNDTIYAAEPDGVVYGVVHSFAATVDPGAVVPGPNGLARLVAGQYRYRRGLHKKKVPALVQAGKVTVERLDAAGKVLKQESGWYGINIHPGGNGERVGEWSRGCQAIRGNDWAEFWGLVEHWDQTYYLYTLLEAV